MQIKSENYEYKNIEKKITSNGCITRKVMIYKNGKGYKSVTTQCPPQKSTAKTRKNKTIKRPLTENEMADIQNKRFIKGLFDDCKKKVYRNK
jgi:hypothetical protein